MLSRVVGGSSSVGGVRWWWGSSRGGVRNYTTTKPPPPTTTTPHTTNIKMATQVLSGGLGLRRWSLMVLLVGRGRQAQALEHMKEVTWCVMRVMSRQCKVHTSQRLRRAMQLYSVYSRMWGEEAARSMFSSLRRTLVSRSRSVLMSALCITSYDWDKEKIPDEKLHKARNDLDSVGELCRATVTCDNCGQRQVIDQQMVNVSYCMCGGSVGYTSEAREYDSWIPFIEREHHIVWRRRHPQYPHLFAYKVYGRYDDVCLSAFTEAQLNCHYRTEWDESALQLRVLGSHPDSNSDLVYWLVKFPTFFANRDYIFKRRFVVGDDGDEVVMISEAVDPDIVQEEKGVHRVNEYWSTMVIRATQKDPSKVGLEYTLTYFDNPGTSLPQSITNFIAASAFPNFLKKLHEAAMNLQSEYEAGEDAYVSLPPQLRYPRPRDTQPVMEEHREPITQELDIVPYPNDSVVTLPATQNKNTHTQNLVESAPNTSSERTSDVISVIKEKSVPDVHREMSLEGVSRSIVSEIPKAAAVVKTANDAIASSPQAQDQDEHIVVTKSASSGEAREESTAFREESTPLRQEPAPSKQEPTPSKQEPSPSPDMTLSVGSKKVVVDLLEAMEVVTPELEGRALILSKIEKLIGVKLEDSDKHSVIIDKLKKLKDKIKSFHERAALKKETSLKKMEELAQRDHYDHLLGDEKTLVQLEMLFQAMKDVLEADRNMRTGKGLRKAHDDPNTKGNNITSPVKESSSDIYSDRSASLKAEEIVETDSKPPTEEDMKDSLRKRKQVPTEKMRKDEKKPPSDDPPPPAPVKTNSPEDVRPNKTGVAEGLGSDRSDSLSDDNQESNRGSSWLHLPYISAWWDGGNNKVISKPNASPGSSKVISEPNPSPSSSKIIPEPKPSITNSKLISKSPKVISPTPSLASTDNKDTSESTASDFETETSTSLYAQVWYIVSMGWIFSGDSKKPRAEDREEPTRDEMVVHKTDCDESSRWYWYPVSGAYRAYVWMFSTSSQSA